MAAQVRGRYLLGWLRRDRSGLALVEFALVAPIMLLLYFGGVLMMDAMACNRKVTVTARATADLVSQFASVTKTDVATILSASSQIMYPYAASKAMIRVSEITTNSSGVSTVTWSQAVNGTGYTAGTAFTVPTSIKTNGGALVYAEVSYAYVAPIAGFGLTSKRTLTQNIYMVPRRSNTVDCTNCT